MFLENQAQGDNRDYAPLSKSPIWEIHLRYYKEMGTEAWQSNAVPNYVTTNPFIASAYARVIGSFSHDSGRCVSAFWKKQTRCQIRKNGTYP